MKKAFKIKGLAPRSVPAEGGNVKDFLKIYFLDKNPGL